MDAIGKRHRPRSTEIVALHDIDCSPRRYHFVCGRSICTILHHSERAARSDLGWLFPKLDIGPCIRIEQVLTRSATSGPVGETSF